MIRRFDFEDEIVRTLACVPMAVRRKLDRVGLKVSMEQWQALSQGDRLAICHLPSGSREECDVLEAFVCEAVERHSGSKPAALNPEQRAAADPPDQPPAQVVEHARSNGVALGPYEWSRLDEDERYALVKLGGNSNAKKFFPAALKEILGRRQP